MKRHSSVTMFTTEALIAALLEILWHYRPYFVTGCRSTAVHMPLLAARVVLQYCLPLGFTRFCDSVAIIPLAGAYKLPSPIVDGADRKQLNADAQISFLPIRAILNGALLPSQCWYLMFNGTFVYLGVVVWTNTYFVIEF